MSVLILIFFIIIIGLAVCSNFLYKKLMICIEEITELKRFNEDVFKSFNNLNNQVSKYQNKQEDLEESFNELKISFRELKEIATEIKSAEQTKKAILELIPR